MARSPLRYGPLAYLVVVLVVGVTVGAVGIRLWQHSHRPRVLLIGDSITDISQPELTDRLRGAYRVEISGAPRRTTKERLHDLPLLLTTKPDRVVINLGTNDVLKARPVSETLSALQTLGQSFPTARCIVLVTVNQNMYSAAHVPVGPEAIAVNRGIRALAARHHWGVVAWDAIVQRYLDAGQLDGSLTLDTVHPVTVGRQLLANAYRSALARCPA